MSVHGIPSEDDREPGRVLEISAYAPRFTFDLRARNVVVEVLKYNSHAAFDADAPCERATYTVKGEEFVGVMRDLADVWPRIAAALDSAIQTRLGGTVQADPPPQWLLDAIAAEPGGSEP